MTYFYDANGFIRRWSDVRTVDALVRLKRKSGSSPWPVIQKCLDYWAETKPAQWKSYLFDLGKIKATRKDRKFASTYDKVHGGYFRYTLDIPEKVMYMIRCIYSADELPINHDFCIEFARRFPKLRVAEKL